MSRNHGGCGSLPVAGFVRREGPSRQPSDFPRTFMAGLASTGSSRPANARPDAALVSPNRPQPRAFYLTPEEPHPMKAPVSRSPTTSHSDLRKRVEPAAPVGCPSRSQSLCFRPRASAASLPQLVPSESAELADELFCFEPIVCKKYARTPDSELSLSAREAGATPARSRCPRGDEIGCPNNATGSRRRT